MHARTVIVGAAVSAVALAAQAGGPVSWADPVDGVWGLAANWDPAVIPGASDDVLLALVGPYAVSVATSSRSAASLTIANPDATLNINGFRTLSLFGDVANQGLIVVNANAVGAGTRLLFETDASISGSGTLRLNFTSTTAELAASLGMQITQEAGHTIAGFGRITGALVNNGLVEADVAGQTLGLFTNDKANNAEMVASNGAILEINSINLGQGPAGVTTATGAGSEIRLASASVFGGVLAGESGGAVVVATSSTMQGVELQGEARVDAFRTLTINGSLGNNAVLTVNPLSVGAGTAVQFNDGATLTGSGEIVLASNATTAELRSAGAPNVNHGPGHTIRGRGRISAALTNQGLISADATGLTLEMTEQDKANESEIEAVNGATLDLQAFTLTQSPGATLTANGADSRVNLAGVTIEGGLLRAENGGLISVRLDSSLADATLEGPLEIQAFRRLDIAGTLTNNGVVTVNPALVGAGTSVRFADGSLLTGNGRVVLASNSTTAAFSSAQDDVVTQGLNHAIEGRGRIDAALVNNGLVEANVPGLSMELTGQTKVNNNQMRAVNGAVLSVTATIEQSPGARMTADGPGSVLALVNATIQGGSIDSANGGTVTTGNGSATVSGVALDAAVEVLGFRTLTIDSGTTNDGSITINPAAIGAGTWLNFASGFTLEGDGLIRLASNSTTAAISGEPGVVDAALGSGQRLEGIGRIQTPLVVHGVLAPGLSVGTMSANQPVALSSTSVFEAEVSGDQASDRFVSTSTFHADGTLDVSFVDGFNPPLTWSAEIVTTGANGVTGAFDTVNAPQPADSRLEFRVVYDSNRIRVGAFCKGDANSDGVLNFFDISDFIADYNAGDPAADISPPFGVLNFFDIAEFITRFNTGCP